MRFPIRQSILPLLLLPMMATMLWSETLEVTLLNSSTTAPVAGIPVRLRNASIGYEAVDTSNAQGKVRFNGLNTSGTYEVSVAENDMFYEARAAGIVLRSGADRSVNLRLYPKKVVQSQDIVIVDQGEADLNTINAEVSSTIGTRQIQDLPVEGRDVTRLLYRLPNVTQATGFFSEAPNVSINGVNGLYAGYLIDGLDNTENFLGGEKFAVPVGFTQSVTVLTNNYSAEFGRTGNGIFNITTKSGSNRLSGEVFYLTRPGPAIDASSPYAQRDLSGNQVKDGFQRQQIGFGLGGAIVPNRTFFYLNFEQTFDFKDNRLYVPQLNVDETVRGTNRFSYGSLKIDHLWSDHFSSSLRANVGLVNIERQGGGLEGGVEFPSAANSQNRNSLLIALRNIYSNDDFTYEGNVQYSRFRWNYDDPANPNSPQVFVLDSASSPLAILGHPGYIFDDVENTVAVQQKISFDLGEHRLKFGAELLSADFSLAGGGNPNGNYVVQLNGAQQRELAARNLGSSLSIGDIPGDVNVTQYSVELRPATFGKRQNVFSLYAEDLFSLSSDLNVTLGLRYDYDNLSVGGSTTGDWNNIAPRFSFNYKLDDRSVLRGGYGLYYDKIMYAVYSDALQQNSTSTGYKAQIRQLIDKGILPANTDIDRVTFDGNVSADLVSDVTYLQGPGSESLQTSRETATSSERRILNPEGYQNPYTHQVSLGYQYKAAGSTLFYVDLIYTASRNLYRLRDLNAPSPYPVTDPDNVVVRTVAEADATRPVPLIEGGARSIVVTETAGKAEYMAATFNLVKEKGEDKFAYRLSYTLSRSYNNTEDINFKAQDANNFGNEWGPSVNDRTHVINGIFYYYPIDGLSLTVAALLQSGQPINRVADGAKFGTTDLNGDGTSYGDQYVGNIDRYPGVSRNSDRLPWSKNVDMGVGYDLPIGDESHVEFRADIFNVFNIANLSGYSNNATQSNQIQVGPNGAPIVERNTSAPRQFQFGVRYLF